VASIFRYAKQKKYEFIEDYYDRFLQLCEVIPQRPHDIYLREAFREGLRTKVKMAIISML
jgi:predicted TIM-barrel fold metal-dependent hydrolase